MVSCGGFEVDFLPVAAFDAGANLRRRPSLSRHPIRIEAFFGARAAFGTVQTFKTTAQAAMPQGHIAAAIARELIQDLRDPGGILIYLHLPRQLKVGPGQLPAMKNRRQRSGGSGSGRVKCWNIGTWAGPLRVRPYTDQCNTEGQPEATRHEIQDSRRLLLTLYDFCARATEGFNHGTDVVHRRNAPRNLAYKLLLVTTVT